MIPVTLARLENYTGFLGSFDNVDWWKSQPLPGNVESFSDAVWVYGQYHVCSARMIDGTYSIFQTNDNGYTWYLVYNTTEKINCMLRTDYGAVVAATSAGWLKSVTSGTSWSKISLQAPNCKTVKEITRSILIALDGTYIWRSGNGGIEWSKSVIKGTSTAITAYTNYPTADGIYDFIIVGCTSTNCTKYYREGRYHTLSSHLRNSKDIILVSVDGGTTFMLADPECTWWYRELTTSNSSYSTSTKSYPSAMPRDVWNDTITDIELTKTPTGIYDKPWFVIQVQMPSGIIRHYYIKNITGSDYSRNNWRLMEVYPEFDAYQSLSDSLYSDEAQNQGEDSVRYFALFSGRDVNNKPMLKISTKGGSDWYDADILNADIYTGPDLSQLSSSNAFNDDNYLLYSWSHGACHNDWKLAGGYLEKNQSLDVDMLVGTWTKIYLPYTIDVLFEKGNHVQVLADILNKKAVSRGYLMDILSRKIEPKTYLMDILNRVTNSRTYSMDEVNKNIFDIYLNLDALYQVQHSIGKDFNMYASKTGTSSHDMDIEIVLRKYIYSNLDSMVLKTCTCNLIHDILNQKRDLTSSHDMDLRIQETIVQDILHRTEVNSPQFPDMGKDFEVRSYDPIDSRDGIIE